MLIELTETTFEVIAMSDDVSPKSMEISQKLSQVEILYILASKPKAVNELTAQLKITFGLETSSKLVSETLADLRSKEFVSQFSSHSISVQGESFSITPLGLSVLTEWIESLSEITLTMQLGLNQRIAIAEE